MRYAIKCFGAFSALAALASCSNFDGKNDGDLETASSAESAGSSPIAVTDDVIKIGAPYSVGGTTYAPLDTAQYDDVGYASSYSSEMAGRPTANGEQFNPAGATAAHKTLPMPSYVEVTALDTGRTILVRVNDRGPLANDRFIDLSEGAARQLGIAPQVVTGVRVRRVNPPEQEKSVLRQGKTAAERIETPEALLKVLRDKLAKLAKPSAALQKPAPVVAKPASNEAKPDGRFIREGGAVSSSEPTSAGVQSPSSSNYVAQIAAFASRARADALARKVDGSVKATADGRLFRVRVGPYPTGSEATSAAQQKGYSQARVYRD